jgi:hypothetical protein
MIFDSIVTFLVGVLNAVLTLFPAWSLPFDPSALAGNLAAGAANANAWFPVSTLGACIGAIFGLRLVMLGWAVAVFIYDKIPFKAS